MTGSIGLSLPGWENEGFYHMRELDEALRERYHPNSASATTGTASRSSKTIG